MGKKVSELEGAELDLWVLRAERGDPGLVIRGIPQPYSTEWSVGGPIIERERIELHTGSAGKPFWVAYCGAGDLRGTGDSALTAAMRAYVASKFGEEVPG
ncbi:phage protein NinX family protein [Caldimonas brevitalea]|uniref:DUF2591 domain-containing protein n=1 Tax=Caldimonas brevitalea TaxID=413882 RepID=A0A0G3BHK4_9BURK|nr:phage protein NinX family protein [Caldimonas brevitalea]AKJ28817.1 hypothetical protein AAW51_2126 [Caldimonas brevitalea]